MALHGVDDAEREETHRLEHEAWHHEPPRGGGGPGEVHVGDEAARSVLAEREIQRRGEPLLEVAEKVEGVCNGGRRRHQRVDGGGGGLGDRSHEINIAFGFHIR